MTAIDVAAPVVGSLSPSRASDFLTCPLLYRFRVIDRLPEAPSPLATRGTVVHSVLDRLFDLPAPERTLDRAVALVRPEWQRLLDADPELAAMFAPEQPGGSGTAAAEPDAPAPPALGDWLEGAADLLGRYFELEDPRRLEPASRELGVDVVLESGPCAGLRLRGYVDRLDVAPGGAVRVVDYKTGRAPAPGFEARAMFQVRFYALVLWRLHGVVPRLLQLLYLGSGEVLRYEPDEADLLATERKLAAVWAAIRRAEATGDWRPRPGRLCDWCEHRTARCPAWGGTPPPLPVREESRGAPAAAAGPAEAPSPRAGPDVV